MSVEKNVPCIACNGSGKKGFVEGYKLPCPYCDGSGVQKSEEENISVGKRCRKVFSNRLPDAPLVKKVW